MKNLIASLVFTVMLVATAAHAQTRVLAGVTGAQEFDNSSLGVTAGIEVPFLKHYELDLRDTFSPMESHVALGGGRANIASVGGFVWLSKSFGLTGHVDDSSYNVTKITKDADYAFGGLAYRGVVGGLPARFTLSYIGQFNNGITPTGLESSHLQGIDFGYTVRFGCLGAVCIRQSADYVVGRILTQGNPQCDGTYGVTGGNGPNGTCPRTSAVGGGVNASILVEFPRRHATEQEIF
jgi:hypothetical protein